jgi:biotin carboxyl carrier protein
MSALAIALVNTLVLVGALLTAAGGETDVATAAGPTSVVAGAPVAPEQVPVEPVPVAPPTAPPSPAPVVTTPPPPPPPRVTTTIGWQPFATAGPVVLHSPGDVVEAIGFHESGHDGAVPQSPLPGVEVRNGLLDQRGRDTHPQGASDIVLDPTREVRSPVTGTVVRAGTYALYCKHTDHSLVVEPDARPGWEVKVLHFEGLQVRAGDRVEAGVTVIGTAPRLLPFSSQIDKHTAPPHWPHVHVEVVDPSVPDRKTGPGCP